MRRFILTAVLFIAGGCGGKESKPDVTAATSAAPPAPPPADAALAAVPVQPPAPPRDESPGHDFTPVAKVLLAVGACGDGPIPEDYPRELVTAHCARVTAAQTEYAEDWLAVAKPFIAERVPDDLPKRVVYPFAGGDLSTALTVYPDADEITTLSLEPAGDPRTLEALLREPTPAGKAAKPKKRAKARALDKALATVRYELNFLYRVNFSNTMNMIDAMRGGRLPTQLIFGLSALKVHGYEIVSLRYFKLDAEGAIQYLTTEDVTSAPAVGSGRPDARNRVFANAELQFKKPGGRVQVYRHIQVNLDDEHLAADPRVLRHLEAKGKVAGMTKAASYLLSWNSFSTMRRYLIDHVVWMISDCTGVAPKWGKPAGFEYETYGKFTGPHISAGNQIWRNWSAEFAAQPKRPLRFRFGYYDKNGANHLVIMRKTAS